MGVPLRLINWQEPETNCLGSEVNRVGGPLLWHQDLTWRLMMIELKDDWYWGWSHSGLCPETPPVFETAIFSVPCCATVKGVHLPWTSNRYTFFLVQWHVSKQNEYLFAIPLGKKPESDAKSLGKAESSSACLFSLPVSFHWVLCEQLLLWHLI